MLLLENRLIFTSNGTLFLKAINVPAWLSSSNPNPTFISSYDTPGGAWGMILSGNYAYVADAGTSPSLQIILG
jgi:hypothetical protein